MGSYKFGGSKIKKFNSDFISGLSKMLCKFKYVTLWVTKKINWVSIDMKHRAQKMNEDSKPITIHITRIVPLDKWSARIEFTINRKEKFCLHTYSDNGDYQDMFASYKRGVEVEIIEAHYFMVSSLRKNWKKM
jgi:hypothetical protein